MSAAPAVAALPRTLARRLVPLQLAVGISAIGLWVPVEKLFMTQIGFTPRTDEPFPGHWRSFPDRWPTVDPADPGVQAALAAVIGELPAAWREVLIARDVLGRDAAEVSERLDLTSGQQRAILNRVRATLRERLDRRLVRDGDE